MGKLEVLCLGVGEAISSLYEGGSSSSLVLLLDGYPVLLVGVGPGVLKACTHYAHLIPECILLLDASLDQTNELSALVLRETNAKRRIRIFGSRQVCGTVGDLLRVQLQETNVATDLVSLVALLVSPSSGDFFSVVHDISVMLHRSGGAGEQRQGGSTSACSAVLCYRDQPVLSIGGAVGFDALLYSKLCVSPFMILWGGTTPSERRASIYDIVAFSDKVNVSRRQEERVVFLITGYGAPQEAPMLVGYVTLLHQGSPVVLLAGETVQSSYGALHLPLPNVRKVQPTRYPLSGKTTVLADDGGGVDGAVDKPWSRGESGASPPRGLTAAALQSSSLRNIQDWQPSRPPTQLEPPHGHIDPAAFTDPSLLENTPIATGTGAYDRRKIYVFTNEDKGAPGKLLLLRNFRNLQQICQKAAQLFSLKPIRDLHFLNGGVVRSMDELPDGVELIAVRRGGAPFNGSDLPRLLRNPPKR